MPSSPPGPPGFQPFRRNGLIEFPVYYMRGGTSTGLVLWKRFVPSDEALCEELLRHLMGVPLTGSLPGNKQITGLGRGPATSNKVFLADIEATSGGVRLVSTLAQLASDHGEIDWSVNCGNMSAALPLWASDMGFPNLVRQGTWQLEISNTNTGVVTTARMTTQPDGRFSIATIPGVDGAFPGVDLFLHDPVGSKTGRLLPTGSVEEIVAGYPVSCVDVAVPMVIVDAAALGKTAHEPVRELEADGEFMSSLRKIWVEAGLRMALRRRDGQLMTAAELERSETIPKICIVGAPRDEGNIAVRYFTPQTGHASMAVSGGCCLAAATLIPGTVAHRLARGVMTPGSVESDIEVGIENPAGTLDATVIARIEKGALSIVTVAYRRSAQILLRGHVPLYRASPSLFDALSHLAEHDTLKVPERLV